MSYSFTLLHNPRHQGMTLTFRPNGSEPLIYRIDSFPITCGGQAVNRIRQFSTSANRDVLLSNILSISRLFQEPVCASTLDSIGPHFIDLLCAYARADGQVVLSRYFQEMVDRRWLSQRGRFNQCVQASDMVYANLVFRRGNKRIQEAGVSAQEVGRISEQVRVALLDPNVAAAAAQGGVNIAQYRAYEISALNNSLSTNPDAADLRLALRKRAADRSYDQAFTIAGVNRTRF